MNSMRESKLRTRTIRVNPFIKRNLENDVVSKSMSTTDPKFEASTIEESKGPINDVIKRRFRALVKEDSLKKFLSSKRTAIKKVKTIPAAAFLPPSPCPFPNHTKIEAKCILIRKKVNPSDARAEFRSEETVKEHECKEIHLKKEVIVKSKSWDSSEALMAAVACPVEDDKKCLESVRDAIEEGANLNFQDEQGTSPLILAARRGHEKVARLLLDHGANVDLFDKENRTALNWAAHRNNEGMVKLLLEYKASAVIKNDKGETCFYTALNEHHKEVSDLLAFSQIASWRSGLPIELLQTSDFNRKKYLKFMAARGVVSDLKEDAPEKPEITDVKVYKALAELGLENKYGSLFALQDVDYKQFLLLGVTDLVEIGITVLEDIDKIITYGKD